MKYVAEFLIYFLLIITLMILAPVLFVIGVVAIILDLFRQAFFFIYRLIYNVVNEKEEELAPA